MLLYTIIWYYLITLIGIDHHACSKQNGVVSDFIIFIYYNGTSTTQIQTCLREFIISFYPSPASAYSQYYEKNLWKGWYSFVLILY